MNEEQICMLMELSMDTAFRKAFAKARKTNFATDAIEELYEVWNEAAERAASQIDEVKS